jgi:hypothetical protein
MTHPLVEHAADHQAGDDANDPTPGPKGRADPAADRDNDHHEIGASVGRHAVRLPRSGRDFGCVSAQSSIEGSGWLPELCGSARR